jgi:hypothetical protein
LFFSKRVCEKMQKKVRINSIRLERFKFKPVEELKTKLKTAPELSVKLKKDFKGTIKAQGISLDEEALSQIRTEWRTQIQTDIRAKAEVSPKKDEWYLTQVLENKPIKLRVSIDKETGQHKKKLRRSR